MIKILFICHGNICRSPMAEFVMKKLVQDAGLEKQFKIESAATSTEEIGNDMYPPAKRKLRDKGVPFTPREARQLRRGDYNAWDYIIGMDEYNRRNMQRICGGDPDGKISLLLDITPMPRSVADPWYTGDFEETWQDVMEGCTALLEKIRQENGL